MSRRQKKTQRHEELTAARNQVLKFMAEIIDEDSYWDRERDHVATEKARAILDDLKPELFDLFREELADHLAHAGVYVTSFGDEPRPIRDVLTAHENSPEPDLVTVYEARDLIPVSEYLSDLDLP